MPTVQDVELQLLREFEKARAANNESRMADLSAALRVVRELFGDHLLMGGR